MQIQEKFNAKLLVEGNDDQHVIWAICEKYKVAETFDVIDNQSDSRVLKRLPLDIRQEAIKTVGVVLDADQNLQERWQSLKTILGKSGYSLPEMPDPEGFIHHAHDIYPKIGIWLMPDNLKSGMLEDFARHLIPPDDRLEPIVIEILNQVEKEGIERCYNPELHRAKAHIHTWLAWQVDPGTPMGMALTKTYLDHNAHLCQRFVGWLNRLFNE
ncbi:DUF3226 domain-containing protein [Spirosoma montaniterrae]|uniref:DUF4435 domain-containing protein n=1 Tax=Spirosoma montaniterrae TaxID=1178516 RepID=A0A1P9X0H5_9BACT|nr:DUF3226 domain-containing protein [Spirosoma montaniterrae]AQG81137.1 hypothetical protein AWR27_18515 [Spirosoma montaniterrae]